MNHFTSKTLKLHSFGTFCCFGKFFTHNTRKFQYNVGSLNAKKPILNISEKLWWAFEAILFLSLYADRL